MIACMTQDGAPMFSRTRSELLQKIGLIVDHQLPTRHWDTEEYQAKVTDTIYRLA
jgi:hypothetical protein